MLRIVCILLYANYVRNCNRNLEVRLGTLLLTLFEGCGMVLEGDGECEHWCEPINGTESIYTYV